MILNHRDLKVYQRAMQLAFKIHEITRSFPKEESYSLTDQIRRSSRSVCAHIAEAWRARRYEKSFVSKLSIAEGEAAETQVWIEFSVQFCYITAQEGTNMNKEYDDLIGSISGMILHSEKWTLGIKEERAEYDVGYESEFPE